MQDIIALIDAAKAGSKQAFGDIYKLYYDRIYRFVYFMTYDEQLAMDLTQNTFLKMWNNLSKFEITKTGTIQSYLFMIARNLVIDFQRRKKELTLDLALNVTQEDDIVEQINKEENKMELKQILKELDETDQELLMLRFFEELPISEIALVVGKEEGAVRVRIHRILKKLRKKIYKSYFVYHLN